MNIVDEIKGIRSLVAGIPKKLYHVTPHAQKIISGGFKIGMPQVMGDAGARSGVSLTADRSFAEDYMVGLQYHILWANGSLEWDDVTVIGREFGLSAKESFDIQEEFFVESGGSRWGIKDAMVRISLLTKKFPWILVSDGGKRLSSLSVNDVDIIQVSLEAEPSDYEYKSSENEWRVYDLDTLNAGNMRIL